MEFNKFIESQKKRHQELLNQVSDMEHDMDLLKAELLRDLPNASDMVQNSIDMCLDYIQQGYEVEHYKAVLAKLSKIKNR